MHFYRWEIISNLSAKILRKHTYFFNMYDQKLSLVSKSFVKTLIKLIELKIVED